MRLRGTATLVLVLASAALVVPAAAAPAAVVLPIPKIAPPNGEPSEEARPRRSESPVDLADYRDRVVRARRLAEKLLPKTRTHLGAHDMAARVNTLLPGVETVRADSRLIQVDNSILRSLVAGLDSAESPSSRQAAAEMIVDHLRSLERSMGPPRERIPEDRKALARLLSSQNVSGRESLAEVVSRFVDKVVRWLRERWSVASERPGLSWVFRLTFYSALGALVLLLAWAVARTVQGLRAAVSRHDSRYIFHVHDEPVVAAAEALPPDVLGHADALAGEGRFREALRALFGGAARTLVEMDIVRQTRTRTNGELLADVLPAAPSVREPLALLSESFERSWYGHSDPLAAGYDGARALYLHCVTLAEGLRDEKKAAEEASA